MILSNRSFRKCATLSLLFICLLGTAWAVEPSSRLDEEALQRFLRSSAHGNGTVVSHQESVPLTAEEPLYSAVFYRLQSGKDALIIVKIKDNRFSTVWSSTIKKVPLGVISPDNLQHISSKLDQYFTFWGCKPHDCGGVSGAYTFEVFQISRSNMAVLDVRECASKVKPTTSSNVNICVSNLHDGDSILSPDAQTILASRIRSVIPGAGDASIEF